RTRDGRPDGGQGPDRHDEPPHAGEARIELGDGHGFGLGRLEWVTVGLMRTRLEDGLVLACNDLAARMLGWSSSEELCGRVLPVDHYLDPGDRMRMIEGLLQHGDVREHETRFRRADGEVIWIRMSVALVRERGWIEGTIEDVTARKQAEIALRESEERFRAIFETARDCVFVKDRNLVYTHANPALVALYDTTPSALVGTTDAALFDAKTAARIREVDLRVLQGSVEEDFSTSRIRGVDHVFHTVKVPLRDDTGTVVGVCGISRDITEQTRAEAVERTMGAILRASVITSDLRALIGEIRDILSGLIDTTNFFVALYDDATGCYSFPYYADKYDVVEPDAAEALPKSLTDYVRRAGQPLLVNRDDFVDLQASGEVELVGTDSVQWLGAPLTRGERVIGVVAVQSYDNPELYTERDINLLGYAAGTISIAIDRARVEEERQALAARAFRSQKMESLGLLAGGIAHEFNNLLQGILGASGLASQLLPADSPVHRQLAAIEKAADAAARLTRQMLAYAGKGRLIVGDVDLSAEIEQTVRYLVGTLPPSAELCLDLQSDLPPITADAAEIRQMVSNLVTNAAEALGEGGGSVLVRTTVESCDRSMLAKAVVGEELAPGSYVVLEVTDTGCGMTADTASKVFDPFFSTKFTGRGLGLAAVAGIVRTNGGGIIIESELGRGTKVWVLLPTLGDQPQAPRPAVAAPSAGKAATTIMVVDDDEVIRSLTREMLEQSGFAVVTAGDGVEAIDRLRAQPRSIDAVLLDMTMPRLSGEETYSALVELRRDLPVIIASGYSEQDAMDRFGSLRPAGFLQKPYRLAELKAAIDRACMRG
ncbi:MAG TPA: PAS domain S-box protein, partial [Thermoanaerobaculales bacterium]|nr:PAS domain S-box protein [Thermoanaerobaculales bacterium]